MSPPSLTPVKATVRKPADPARNPLEIVKSSTASGSGTAGGFGLFLFRISNSGKV